MSLIIYIGDQSEHSTARHRANALQRLGHNVIICNPYEVLRASKSFRYLDPIHYRTGYILLQSFMKKWLSGVLQNNSYPDLIWIDSGELFGPACIRLLNEKKIPVILYNVDDPTGKRDGGRFASLRKALPYYDLVAVVRKETEAECKALGAHQVMRVFRSYDEVAHHPYEQVTDIPQEFRSEVAFIGTWMRHEHREEFLLKLIEKGVPVSIWGSRWEKSPSWDRLKNHYRGGALGGRKYVAAIQGAKVCLGFLSKGNRDLHTTRSLEVPYAGGLLCAERTEEHLALYEDGVEACFWADADECAVICKELIQNDTKREQIKTAARKKVLRLGVGNEDICRSVLERLQALQANK